MKVLLASKSPRRRKMLTELNIAYDVWQGQTDENTDLSLPPETIVKTIAKKKAVAAFADTKESDTLIIAADTIVYHNGKVLGKPSDDEDAFKMLSSLSDSVHYVYSGVCAVYNGKTVSDFEKTEIKFRKLSEKEIRKYLETGEHRDKAGSYGIQEKGGYFTEWVNGDINNVVGLPVLKLRNMIKQNFDTDLFDM